MGLFDKISSMAKDATDKASDLVEIQKLNSRINDDRSRITRLKQQIGDHYFVQFEEGAVLDSEATELCDQISNLNKHIKEIESQIESIKFSSPPSASQTEETRKIDTVVCPSCGSEVESGKKFCPECGFSLESEEEKTSDIGMSKCSSCGAQVEEGLKFCPECGQKIE